MAYLGYCERRPLIRGAVVPRRADIIAAIPRGSRRLRSRQIERRYLAALDTWPAMGRLRADARANTLTVAKFLARWADYETGVSRPTRAMLCEQAKLSPSTWKAARRRLERWGFLGLVAPGCKRWRPGRDGLPVEVRHDAAVYVVCVPRKTDPAPPPAAPSQLTRPPAGIRRIPVLIPARGTAGKGSEGAAPRRRAHRRTRRAAASDAPADQSAAALAGAMAAALRQGPGKILTNGWCGYLSRAFAAAGWTPADLAYAVDYLPDGRQHRAPVRDVKSPHGWIRWRLAHWIRDGHPAESPSQARARIHAADLEHARQLRAAAAARADQAADPRPHVAAIFATEGWHRPARPDELG